MFNCQLMYDSYEKKYFSNHWKSCSEMVEVLENSRNFVFSHCGNYCTLISLFEENANLDKIARAITEILLDCLCTHEIGMYSNIYSVFDSLPLTIQSDLETPEGLKRFDEF